MSVIHTPRKPDLDFRMLVFPGVMLCAFSVLFMRLWYFQVVKAQELVEKADASRTIEVTQPAPRGLIYDRNGELIAGVKPEFVVTAMPTVLKKHPEVLDKVAAILGVSVDKFDMKLKEAETRPDLFSPIYVGADMQAGIKIGETRDDLPGIGVQLQPMRYYPDTKSFTHLLGYVWTPNDKDIKRIEDQNRKPADYVGKAGIERAFETTLMGDPGREQREIDAKRRSVRSMGGDAPNPGDQLILSIDSKLQKFATEFMAKNRYVGGVVALDPKTGEVLCLVSSPTFDQNLFTRGISATDWKGLSDPEHNQPLLNRAIGSSYAPGSTFKIVTSIAAYESGKFDSGTHFKCDGGIKVGNKFFKCLGYHGSIGYNDAMAKSCNSYFYQLGRNVGPDALRQACYDVGLGQKQGIEIGESSKGVIPTEEYLERYYRRTRNIWHTGDMMNFSIGQGFVSATPLQLANLAALVANNGTNYKPHLVREIRAANGKGPVQEIKPEVLHHVQASSEFWSELQGALVGVVDHGTATKAKIPGVIWGGKTGSAEHGTDKSGKTKTHAIFVGFAPAKDPKIALCILIEGVGHGGDFAAEPAKDIVEAYLAEGKSKDLAAPGSAGRAIGLANSAPAASASPALTRSPTAR